LVHLLDGTTEDVVKTYHQVREEMGLYDPLLLEKPEIVAVNKIDITEVREALPRIMESLEKAGIQAALISAETGEGVGELLDRIAILVGEQRQLQRPPVQGTSVIEAKPRRERPFVEKDGDAFVVKSPKAERLVRRVDLGDQRVQVQLWRELQRLGVVRVLERVGAKQGSVVRIGDYELEWK